MVYGLGGWTLDTLDSGQWTLDRTAAYIIRNYNDLITYTYRLQY